MCLALVALDGVVFFLPLTAFSSVTSSWPTRPGFVNSSTISTRQILQPIEIAEDRQRG
jgi:hypothetical protein